MSWEKIKLSDCCLSIADGDHQPPPKADFGIPFVTIANITSSNQFDFNNTLHVPREYYEKLDDKRRPEKNDILYSVVGSFGIPVFMKENKEFVFQRHIAILRPKDEIIYPRFLYYSMLTKEFYAQADAAAIGAAQRTVSLGALRNMVIAIPSMEDQIKISEILSAYDDLIETNQRQIKLLEEAAQRLYKEWFVDLRFPGHENVPVVDGVPEGLHKISVAQCLMGHINGGWGKESPLGKNVIQGRVIRGTDINDIKNGHFSDIPLRFHTENDIVKRALKSNDIVFELSNGNIDESFSMCRLSRTVKLRLQSVR